MRASRNKARRHRVCLLLGSNIQPVENLRRTVELLGEQLWLRKSLQFGSLPRSARRDLLS